jgi:hypothetical protein
MQLALGVARLQNEFEKSGLDPTHSTTSMLREITAKLPPLARRKVMHDAIRLRAAALGIKKLKALACVTENTLYGDAAKRFLRVIGFSNAGKLSDRIEVRLYPYSVQVFGAEYDTGEILGSMTLFHGVTAPRGKHRRIGNIRFKREMLKDPQISLALKSITVFGPPAPLAMGTDTRQAPFHTVKETVSTHERQHAFDILLSRHGFSPNSRRGWEMLLRSELGNIGLGNSIHHIENPSIDLALKDFEGKANGPWILHSSLGNNKSPLTRRCGEKFRQLIVEEKRLHSKKPLEREQAREFCRTYIQQHMDTLVQFLLTEKLYFGDTPAEKRQVIQNTLTKRAPTQVLDFHLLSLTDAAFNSIPETQAAVQESGQWVRQTARLIREVQQIANKLMEQKKVSQQVFAAICRVTPLRQLPLVLARLSHQTTI